MDICKDYGKAPINAVILGGITVPEKTDPKRDDTIKDWFADVVPEGAVSYDVHTTVGQPANRLLVCMSDQKDLELFREKVKHGSVTLNKTGEVVVMFVYDDFLTSMEEQHPQARTTPNSALLRRIKDFSDLAKPGPRNVFEWVSVAMEILENESSLSEEDKLWCLMNSLVKDALAAMSSGVIQKPGDLIKTISAAFGADRTAEQLSFAFFALKHNKGE